MPKTFTNIYARNWLGRFAGSINSVGRRFQFSDYTRSTQRNRLPNSRYSDQVRFGNLIEFIRDRVTGIVCIPKKKETKDTVHAGIVRKLVI